MMILKLKINILFKVQKFKSSSLDIKTIHRLLDYLSERFNYRGIDYCNCFVQCIVLRSTTARRWSLFKVRYVTGCTNHDILYVFIPILHPYSIWLQLKLNPLQGLEPVNLKSLVVCITIWSINELEPVPLAVIRLKPV